MGTAEEFANWLHATGEAWFFLDSVDEAQLGTPRALEDAVRIFGAKIHAALERAHIFITSREDAWRALPDQTLIEQYLPYGEPAPAKKKGDTDEDGDFMLRLFRLAGLSENDISLFSAHISHYSPLIMASVTSPILSMPLIAPTCRRWQSDLSI